MYSDDTSPLFNGQLVDRNFYNNGEAKPVSFSLTLSDGFEETSSTDSHQLGSLLRHRLIY